MYAFKLIGDQAQYVFPRDINIIDIIAVMRIFQWPKYGPLNNLRHPDNGVQGRAQLMVYGGHELFGRA